MSIVSRQKYDSLKTKAQKWADLVEELNVQILRLTKDNESLSSENEDLHSELSELKKQDPVDTEQVEVLEEENRELKKHIRSLKKKLSEEDEHVRDMIILKNELLFKDGKINQLQDTVESLRDRYKELKEDYRDQIRSERGKKEA